MSEAITIKTVYDEIIKLERKMVTKSEIGTLLQTVEIIANKDTMNQLANSKEDLKQGRVKKISSVKDILSA